MARARSPHPVKPTILIDTREKPANRLFEPSEAGDKEVAAYQTVKIDAGDYTLHEFPDLVVVEKKQDGKELYGNCILKSDVFMRSIERMRAFKHKYIVIQQSYAEFLNPKNWAHVSRGYPRRFAAMAAVESWLIALSQNEGIHFVWAGKDAARLTKKILVKSYTYERKRLMKQDQERDEEAI